MPLRRDDVFLWLLRIFMVMSLMSSVFAMLGCAATTRQKQQTQVVEVKREETHGNLVIQKAEQPVERHDFHIVRTEQTTENTQTAEQSVTHVELPKIPSSPTIWPSLSSFGVIEAVLSGLAALFGWRWWKSRKQRDQIIRSVEFARRILPKDLDQQFTLHLATRQDDDTQQTVKEKTR